MRRAAIRGLLGRKLRTVLTAMAVVLGVAMVSGTYVLTDTIKQAFDSIFSTSYQNTSAIISGRQIVQDSASGSATVPQSLEQRVQRLPDVQQASGAIFDVSGSSDIAKLLDKDGQPISNGGAPTFGWGIDPGADFNPLSLTSGNWAAKPNQVVIDGGTASKDDFGIGDSIDVSARGPTRRFEITGIAKFGDVESVGGATFAIFQVPTAQALMGKQGQFDAIFVKGTSGSTPDQVAQTIQPLLPPSAQVQTGAEQAASNAKDINDGLKFIQYLLLAFAAIALIVGSFVIFNTMSMTVAQRVRELATLRTVGASRRQVLRSVLLEGLIIGCVASIVGLFLGIGLAKGINAVFVAVGVDLPHTGTVLATRTIIVSLALGIGITVLAALSPARRATRVPPIAAVQEGATLPASGLESHSSRAGLIAVVIGAVALTYGLFVNGAGTGAKLLAVGVGCLAMFAAVGFFSRRAVVPLAAIVGAPAERIGGTIGRLARANSTRNPARTARTAAALMIALALVTFVATLGSGMGQSDRSALTDQVQADYVVTSDSGFEPFTASAGRAVARAPGVEAASSVRGDQAKIFGADTTVSGIDPATIDRFYSFRWSSGSDASVQGLGRTGAVVKKTFADDNDLEVGSPFTMTTPDGKDVRLQVAGIFDPPFDALDSVLGAVAIPQKTFDSDFPRAQNAYTFVDVNGGASSQASTGLDRALEPFPDATLRTKSEWVDNRAGGLNQILNIFYVLLALSVLISLFGMVNALVLSVFERTRELGMLRSVGMTRRQARHLIRQESVITALIGASLGLPLGVLLALVITGALRGQDLAFSIPVTTLVVLVVGALLAGMLAAILPARRASRIDVLEALQYE